MIRNVLFGLDLYETSYPIDYFLNKAVQSNLEIYDVLNKENTLFFYCPIYMRKMVQQTFPSCQYIKTTGLIGFLLSQVRQPRKVIMLIWIVGLWFMMQHTIINIEVIGAKTSLKIQIEEYMKVNHSLPIFSLKFDEEALKKEIYSAYTDDIAWIEIDQQGSKVKIFFTAKEYASTTTLESENLYATKDALIAGYDVQHGDIVVDIDEFVRKDDLLVRNYLYDAFQRPKNVYVKGKVYGYTWYTVEVELNQDERLIEPLAYARLLLDSRNEISKEIKSDEKIIKETVLLFTKDSSKIKMKVHYTLYEDITAP